VDLGLLGTFSLQSIDGELEQFAEWNFSFVGELINLIYGFNRGLCI